MAETKKKKKAAERITTPKGRAIWAWLTKPDTQFKADGEYKIDLVFTPEECGELKDRIDTLVEEAYEKATKGAKPAQAKKVVRHYPYKEELDEDENETGNLVFQFRSNAFFKKENGEKVSLKPALFDGQGAPIRRKIMVGNGSTCRVNFTPSKYFAKNLPVPLAGVKLYINGVQIVELVEFGGASAESMGFGQEDGGFDATSEDVPFAEGEVPVEEYDDDAVDF